MAIWCCKIGEANRSLLPYGADAPLRDAIQNIYIDMLGVEPDFCFSGWGGELDETEREAAFSMNRQFTLKPVSVETKANLGLATTEELLKELQARAEIGGYSKYRTVSD